MELTHWRRLDSRKGILEMIVSGMQSSINQLHSQVSSAHWYDGGFFVEDVEPIMGLAYVAYQNYIISSIYDRFGNIADRNTHYKKGSKIIYDKRTEIELIIALANYYKHRDDEKHLHSGTKSVLNDLNLEYIEITEPENLPILKGTDILSPSWDLNVITKKVTDWRETIWESE
jgi:hypothetical protein